MRGPLVTCMTDKKVSRKCSIWQEHMSIGLELMPISSTMLKDIPFAPDIKQLR